MRFDVSVLQCATEKHTSQIIQFIPGHDEYCGWQVTLHGYRVSVEGQDYLLLLPGPEAWHFTGTGRDIGGSGRGNGSYHIQGGLGFRIPTGNVRLQHCSTLCLACVELWQRQWGFAPVARVRRDSLLPQALQDCSVLLWATMHDTM